ncbi:hypothetical protein BDY17DRAFT_322508 [Neohortaea acidophila]|uniref:Uncharacterized protein n=1 Tax=Neohortaea acidophila TaxID=245834 RepID=A0A6A6Q120_9PEZI|nr:uncharacterized protein BDY17DRAFT_322508 [Neohortaea acidophila]KAF2485686.1 hypothetical protein BDY17DRAFT_322508 [Neohortaea acidophila]
MSILQFYNTPYGYRQGVLIDAEELRQMRAENADLKLKLAQEKRLVKEANGLLDRQESQLERLKQQKANFEHHLKLNSAACEAKIEELTEHFTFRKAAIIRGQEQQLQALQARVVEVEEEVEDLTSRLSNEQDASALIKQHLNDQQARVLQLERETGEARVAVQIEQNPSASAVQQFNDQHHRVLELEQELNELRTQPFPPGQWEAIQNHVAQLHANDTAERELPLRLEVERLRNELEEMRANVAGADPLIDWTDHDEQM